MKLLGGNVLADVRTGTPTEEVITLLSCPDLRIERIVSHGHASEPAFWYDQEWDEWVLVLSGAARLSIEGEKELRWLGRGDFLHIPAHVRHRVEWTDPNQPTVWLAIHHC
jgi:cupin 2 domain-containing protein